MGFFTGDIGLDDTPEVEAFCHKITKKLNHRIETEAKKNAQIKTETGQTQKET